MTLIIEKGITLRKGYIGTDDPDAAAYIAAVEAADEAESPGVGALETATKVAIHSFVKGCKADGIWPAIKASCILAGARTLTGALVPLVGAAPTNFNFASGDYNRKTGLVGDGSTKYLDSNRNNNADPQNSKHLSIFVSSANTAGSSATQGYIGSGLNTTGACHIFTNSAGTRTIVRIHNEIGFDIASVFSIGFIGTSRSAETSSLGRAGSNNTNSSLTSQVPQNQAIWVFGRNLQVQSDARIAFYSIGESLDLALLDSRVTDLINAFAAAIP